jgi:hypothetical protein
MSFRISRFRPLLENFSKLALRFGVVGLRWRHQVRR